MPLKSKYKYRDLSLIRWVNDLSHFNDRFNIQNNQHFGTQYAHKLQIRNNNLNCLYDGLHRLVITNYFIDYKIPEGGVISDLTVWYVTNKEEVQLSAVCNFRDRNIFYITFQAKQIREVGRLELRSGGETIKYSECVVFVDEPLVILHTRNWYNRHGLLWAERPINNWIRTTLPAKRLGLSDVDPERTIENEGSKNTPLLLEQRNDLIAEYEYLPDGKGSVLDSIEALSGNVIGSDEPQGGFYLDLDKVTPNSKLDRADSNMLATGTYIVHSSDDGIIQIDDDLVFSDLIPVVINLVPPDESILTETVDNSTPLEIEYNIPFILTTDETKEIRLYKDEVLIETFTINNIVGVSGNTLQIKGIEAYNIGEYRIEVDKGFVIDETFELFESEEITDWNFTVREFKYFEDQFEDQFE